MTSRRIPTSPLARATARPARRRSAHAAPPRIGLALAGGGPLGGVYEISALAALEESRPLVIVATDLDSGEAERFGQRGHEHVPISRAAQASAAVPGLFPPVEIGVASMSTARCARRCMRRSHSKQAPDRTDRFGLARLNQTLDTLERHLKVPAG